VSRTVGLLRVVVLMGGCADALLSLAIDAVSACAKGEACPDLRPGPTPRPPNCPTTVAVEECPRRSP